MFGGSVKRLVFVDFDGEFADDFGGCGECWDWCDPDFPFLVECAAVVESDCFEEDESSVAEWFVDDAFDFDVCHVVSLSVFAVAATVSDDLVVVV